MGASNEEDGVVQPKQVKSLQVGKPNWVTWYVAHLMNQVRRKIGLRERCANLAIFYLHCNP